ncbi:MAG TPA: dihydroorotate dehydrogenase [Candidatus Acidoferrales bacterium]|nr:dihydroorotate dehydrogenase [Candidatus Acidoferrales bacterium]
MTEPGAAGVDLGRGLILPNPVGLASGTAGYGFELAQLIELDRLGALYTKGTTAAPREGNPPPRVAETGGGMLNSIGLQNPGVDVVARDYAPRWRDWTIRVIVNIAGGSLDEYVHCARVLEDVAEIAGLELNISCPNITGGLDFGRDPVAAGQLVAAVRAVTERCIIVKLSPNVTDIAAVARAVEEAGADAVSAVNTFIGRKIHRASGRSVLPLGTGGMSGPAIQPLALAAVAAVCDAVHVPVVGVGGIVDAASAKDFLTVGARAVQVGTATFVNPETALHVLDGLGV